jgi:hypothetical protein
MSWCRAQSGTFDQRYVFFKVTVLSFIGAPSLARGQYQQTVQKLNKQGFLLGSRDVFDLARLGVMYARLIGQKESVIG